MRRATTDRKIRTTFVVLGAGFAATLSTILSMAWVRASQDRIGRDLAGQMAAARANFQNGRWARHRGGDPEEHCNGIRIANDALKQHQLVWDTWSTADQNVRAVAADALRASLRCDMSFWPQHLPPARSPELDYALHERAVRHLLEFGDSLSAKDCLLVSLDSLRLAHDLVPGGRELRVAVANEEARASIIASLHCLKRATPTDVRGVAMSYLVVAGSAPPLHWTVQYHLLRDAEFEQTLFNGRPLVPKFWDGTAYSLTSGSRILPRYRDAILAMQRGHALGAQGEGHLARLANLLATLPANLGESLRKSMTVSESQKRAVLVRALACGLWWVGRTDESRAQAPGVCLASEGREGSRIRFVPAGNEVLVYGFGPNGRDEGGEGDDEGVRLPLVAATP